jgi:hypothetical protein
VLPDLQFGKHEQEIEKNIKGKLKRPQAMPDTLLSGVPEGRK